MTSREQHLAKIRELEEAMARSNSEKLKKDFGKAVARLKRELRTYDKLRGKRDDTGRTHT